MTALGSYKLDTGTYPTTEAGSERAARQAGEREPMGGSLPAAGSARTIPGAVRISTSSPASTAMSRTSSPRRRRRARRRRRQRRHRELEELRRCLASSDAGAAAPQAGQAGVTLMEMLVVMAIIAIAAAIAFPAVNSGIESLRLKSASDAIVSFLNSGLNRAERRQQLIEITISRSDNNIVMRSEDPNFVRTLSLPEGVTIVRIHPEDAWHRRNRAQIRPLSRRIHSAARGRDREPARPAANRACRSDHRRAAGRDGGRTNQ